MEENQSLSLEEIEKISTKEGLKELLAQKGGKYKTILDSIAYEEELKKLQVELVLMFQFFRLQLASTSTPRTLNIPGRF